ncbi:endonuclease/exonuclease/phosphatase family protein [Halovulum sp. GXIMD14793]
MNGSFHPQTTFRLASYNIRKCVGLDRRRRPDRILQVIADLNSDIVVLQEADRRLGARPATLCRQQIQQKTGLTALHVSQNDVSLGWHGNTILVRPGIEVTGIETLVLPGLEPRGAVIAHLRLQAHPVIVVAVHLGLTRRHRQGQLQAICDRLPDGVPALIAGDFNEWSGTKGLDALHRFNVHAPGRSFHAARPLAALDRIATSAGVDVLRSAVCRDGHARRASDHLPIWADIRLCGACNGEKTGVDAPPTVGV